MNRCTVLVFLKVNNSVVNNWQPVLDSRIGGDRLPELGTMTAVSDRNVSLRRYDVVVNTI